MEKSRQPGGPVAHPPSPSRNRGSSWNAFPPPEAPGGTRGGGSGPRQGSGVFKRLSSQRTRNTCKLWAVAEQTTAEPVGKQTGEDSAPACSLLPVRQNLIPPVSVFLPPMTQVRACLISVYSVSLTGEGNSQLVRVGGRGSPAEPRPGPAQPSQDHGRGDRGVR